MRTIFYNVVTNNLNISLQYQLTVVAAAAMCFPYLAMFCCCWLSRRVIVVVCRRCKLNMKIYLVSIIEHSSNLEYKNTHTTRVPYRAGFQHDCF